jgi:PAS domain S-box-containing protein
MKDRRVQSIPVDINKRSVFTEGTLEKMLDKMNIAVIIIDGARILYSNDTFHTLTKYSREELTHLTVQQLMTPESVALLSERILKRMEGDTTLPDVYEDLEFIKKSGEHFTVDLYPGLMPYYGQICAVYTGVETTSIRKTELALNGFFDYCPLPGFITNKQNRIIKATKYYEKSLGKSMLEIVGKTTDELFSPEFAKKIKEEDDIVFKTKKSITVDEIHNGKHYVKIKFPINGDLIGGFSVDITEKIESERKYQDLYNVLSSMLDTLPDMLWVYDRKKEIRFSNKALRENYPTFNVFDSYECMEIVENEETFAKSVTVDNKEFTFEITKTPLLDNNGDIVGCCGKIKDITETIKKQEKIMKKLIRLEDSTLKKNKEAMQTLNNTITLFNKRWGI